MIPHTGEKQFLSVFRLQLNCCGWRKWSAIWVFAMFQICAVAQTAPISSRKMAHQIQRFAEQSFTCLLNQDFDEYLNFVYPSLVAETAEMLNWAKQMQANSIEEGFPLPQRKVKVGKPGPILQYQNELQCVLPVEATIYRNKGPMKATFGVICVSMDGGGRWYILEPGRNGLEELRQKCPNVSPELRLIVPTEYQPVDGKK
jgi:hypothetical protein